MAGREHRSTQEERDRRVSLYPLSFTEAVSALLQTKPSREPDGEEAKRNRKQDSAEEGGGERA